MKRILERGTRVTVPRGNGSVRAKREALLSQGTYAYSPETLHIVSKPMVFLVIIESLLLVLRGIPKGRTFPTTTDSEWICSKVR